MTESSNAATSPSAVKQQLRTASSYEEQVQMLAPDSGQKDADPIGGKLGTIFGHLMKAMKGQPNALFTPIPPAQASGAADKAGIQAAAAHRIQGMVPTWGAELTSALSRAGLDPTALDINTIVAAAFDANGVMQLGPSEAASIAAAGFPTMTKAAFAAALGAGNPDVFQKPAMESRPTGYMRTE